MPSITQTLGFNATGANKNLASLASNLDNATEALRRLNEQAQKSGLKNAGQALDKVNKKAESFTLTWKSLLRVVGTQFVMRGITKAISQMTEGIERARELGLAIAEIKTISGGPAGLNVGNLTDEVLALSEALGESANVVAEGVYQTLSNQVVDAADAMSFYEQAAKLALITSAESAEAVNAMSSAMNSYGFAAGEAGRVSDTLFKTIELGRIRMSELGDSVGRVLPLASQMGVSFEESMAAMAVMTRQGVKAATASTQLRAVLQKLLRPSEAMQEIFEKWGVESGPEAIKAFGGLRGVLEKLQDETNGNVGEMGELFQRVRSITAALALGVDNGKQFEDTLNGISDGAGSAKAAIDEYMSTEAFLFTQDLQEYENQWTRLGKEAIPLASFAVKTLTNNLKFYAEVWDTITGRYDQAYDSLERVKQRQKELKDEIQETKDALESPEADRLEELLKQNAAYYADINKQELRLRQIRDDSVKSANKSLKKAGDAVLKHYKDSTKKLKDFIADAEDAVKDGAKRIKDLQIEIDDEILQNKLDNAQNEFQKQRLLDDAISKARREAEKATRDVSADPDTREAAVDAAKRYKSLLDQGKAIAEATDQEFKKRQYQDEGVKALQLQQDIERKHTAEIQKQIPKAKELAKEREQGEKDLQRLMKQRFDLLQKLGDAEPGSEEQKAIGKELKGVDDEIAKIFDKTKIGKALRDAIGLKSNYTDITGGVQAALDQATFDWAREVDRAKAAFESEVFRIKLEVDPTGAIAAAAEQLGVDKGTDTEVTHAAKVTERMAEATRNRDESLTSIQTKMMTVAGLEGDIFEATKGALQATQERINLENRQKAQTSGFTGIGGTQTPVKFTEVLDSEIFKGVQEFTTELRTASQELAAGKQISDEQVQSLKDKLATLKENNYVEGETVNLLTEGVRALEQQRAVTKQVNDEAKNLAPKEELDTRKLLIEQMNTQVRKQGESKTAAEATKRAVDGAKQSLENSQGASQGLKTNMEGAAVGAGDTAQATNDITSTLPQAISLAGQLEGAWQGVARAAAAAAQASAAAASASAGATAYHGGPMGRYFAAGGSLGMLKPRGQDKILTSLSSGETVVNSKNSKRFFSELNAMNQGAQPVYRDRGGPVTNVGDINVSVKGGDSSQHTVREIAHALRRDVQRGIIKLH